MSDQGWREEEEKERQPKTQNLLTLSTLLHQTQRTSLSRLLKYAASAALPRSTGKIAQQQGARREQQDKWAKHNKSTARKSSPQRTLERGGRVPADEGDGRDNSRGLGNHSGLRNVRASVWAAVCDFACVRSNKQGQQIGP